eukprot:1576560-Amphidinium_carterae.1
MDFRGTALCTSATCIKGQAATGCYLSLMTTVCTQIKRSLTELILRGACEKTGPSYRYRMVRREEADPSPHPQCRNNTLYCPLWRTPCTATQPNS